MGGGPHCLVIGVGAGTGAAVARRFADGGYRISMIARSAERLAGFQASVPASRAWPVDIADQDRFRATLAQICDAGGVPDVIVYNATQATFGRYHDIDVGKFERNFRVNAAGLLIVAQEFAPAMAERGTGALIVTGNTGSGRGMPAFVGWSPSKAAQRILAECLARELGPQGVHVAYVVIDALIDMPFTRRRFGDRPAERFARPDDIADEVFHTAHQPASTRAFLVEIRPHGESW